MIQAIGLKRPVSPVVTIAFAVLFFGSADWIPRSAVDAAALDSKSRTRNEFQELWQSRLESYRSKRAPVQERERLAAQAFSGAPFTFEKSDTRLTELISAGVSTGELDGRGLLLSDFVTHMSKKPSVGLTQAWLQSELDKIRTMDAESEALREQAIALLSSKTAKVADFLVAIDKAAEKRGETNGRAEELILLVANFDAFASEIARADERDREARQRFANALTAFSNSMRANQSQSWMFQCHAAGPTMNCFGN